MEIAQTPKPTVSVAAIVFDAQHRVLLIKREKAPSAGLWSIPGGRQESGETLSEACEREVMEETGITVCPTQIIAVAERMEGPFHYVIIDFLALYVADDKRMKAASDALEAAWVSLNDLGKYGLAEGVEPVLKTAYEVFKSHGNGLKVLERFGETKKTLDFLASPLADQ